MGKKKLRSARTSKGEHRSVSKETLKLVRSSVSMVDNYLNKVKAWRKSQNPWITVPGRTKNMSYVRVRANVLWGDPKRRTNPEKVSEA